MPKKIQKKFIFLKNVPELRPYLSKPCAKIGPVLIDICGMKGYEIIREFGLHCPFSNRKGELIRMFDKDSGKLTEQLLTFLGISSPFLVSALIVMQWSSTYNAACDAFDIPYTADSHMVNQLKSRLLTDLDFQRVSGHLIHRARREPICLQKQARMAPNLPEKIDIQKKTRALDRKRDEAWREYDVASREIEGQKDTLIDQRSKPGFPKRLPDRHYSPLAGS